VTPDERVLLDALVDQGGLAIERCCGRGHGQRQAYRRIERLRSALLTSISHDLKTPLASVLGRGLDHARPRRQPHRGPENDLARHRDRRIQRLTVSSPNLLDMTSSIRRHRAQHRAA